MILSLYGRSLRYAEPRPRPPAAPPERSEPPLTDDRGLWGLLSAPGLRTAALGLLLTVQPLFPAPTWADAAAAGTVRRRSTRFLSREGYQCGVGGGLGCFTTTPECRRGRPSPPCQLSQVRQSQSWCPCRPAARVLTAPSLKWARTLSPHPVCVPEQAPSAVTRSITPSEDDDLLDEVSPGFSRQSAPDVLSYALHAGQPTGCLHTPPDAQTAYDQRL
jgi:hypothetical protein